MSKKESNPDPPANVRPKPPPSPPPHNKQMVIEINFASWGNPVGYCPFKYNDMECTLSEIRSIDPLDCFGYHDPPDDCPLRFGDVVVKAIS